MARHHLSASATDGATTPGRARARSPAIIATTTADTEVSDLMDRSLGLGDLWGSVLLIAVALLALILFASVRLARKEALSV